MIAIATITINPDVSILSIQVLKGKQVRAVHQFYCFVLQFRPSGNGSSKSYFNITVCASMVCENEAVFGSLRCKSGASTPWPIEKATRGVTRQVLDTIFSFYTLSLVCLFLDFH